MSSIYFVRRLQEDLSRQAVPTREVAEAIQSSQYLCVYESPRPDRQISTTFSRTEEQQKKQKVFRMEGHYQIVSGGDRRRGARIRRKLEVQLGRKVVGKKGAFAEMGAVE